MLQYIPLRKYKRVNRLNNLWNKEFASLFPISANLYKQKILDDPNFNKDASFVALYDNEPVGFIIIKTWLSDSGFLNEEGKAYISLIFVNKEMRNMGIGTDMLTLAIKEIKKNPSIRAIQVGNESNRLICGIPNDISNASIFFINKGFYQLDSFVDFIKISRKESILELDTFKETLKYRVATEEDKDEILKLCLKNGWNRSAYLLNHYFENGGSGRRVVVACKDDKIIGLARIYEENKSPLKINIFTKDSHIGEVIYIGVDSEYENQGYELEINKACENYLVKRGCKKIIVPASNKISFYKSLGYSAFKYYLRFELDF